MKLLLINDILRHTYGLKEIRSIKENNNKAYSFKTKYSDTQFVGTFFEHPYNTEADEMSEEVVEANATEQCFAIEFNNAPSEREVELLKLIREKFNKNDCFVSLYNTDTDEPLEI